MNLSVDCEGNTARSNFIDLNLNVNGDFYESSKTGDWGCDVVENLNNGDF